MELSLYSGNFDLHIEEYENTLPNPCDLFEMMKQGKFTDVKVTKTEKIFMRSSRNPTPIKEGENIYSCPYKYKIYIDKTLINYGVHGVVLKMFNAKNGMYVKNGVDIEQVSYDDGFLVVAIGFKTNSFENAKSNFILQIMSNDMILHIMKPFFIYARK